MATSPYEKHIFICTNQRRADHPRGCCDDKGGSEVRLKFADALARRGLKSRIRANKAGCLNACELGVAVVIYPAGIWYLGVTPQDVEEIVETSLAGDGVVERLAAGPDSWERLASIRGLPEK
jgi:(2Fe-2S) ferredoxin